MRRLPKPRRPSMCRDTPCGASQAFRRFPQLSRRRVVLCRLRHGNKYRAALQLEHAVRRKVASGKHVCCCGGAQCRHRSMGSVMGHECFQDLIAEIFLPFRPAGLKVRWCVTRMSRVAHQTEGLRMHYAVPAQARTSSPPASIGNTLSRARKSVPTASRRN